MQHHLRTDLVLAALEMAVGKRRPAAGLIHHSDHGCQFTSVRFGERWAAAGIYPSMGTVGDRFDNAMVEASPPPWSASAGPPAFPDPRGGTNNGL